MKRSWKTELFNTQNIQFADDKLQIFKGIVPQSLSFQFHKKMPKGAALRELKDQHLHLAYWETPYYKDAITKHLKEVDRKNTIVADIGCGDGRFTEFLLELGFSKIIATDIDLTPLQSLAEYLQVIGATDKVLLINTELENLPLRSEICDAILSIAVLYYLNDNYDQGLKEVTRLLKTSGIFVNSEPDMEGALYKSIIFETLEDVFENFFDRKFKEEKGETPYKFRLFSEQEITKKLNNAGLTVQDKYGLSLFPLIIRIMMVRGEIEKEALSMNESKLREVLDYLNGNGKLNKNVIWKSQKIETIVWKRIY
jgi:ubiquinone/menaquinone biosynthesis C-methylase UbiE